MIEINLLPSAGKKSRSRGTGGPKIGALFAGVLSTVKDPYMIGAAAAVIASLGTVGALYGWQTARERSLLDREQQAVQDSTNYAAVLKQKAKAEAQRDSVLRQLNIIRSIDNNRFVWPHILDEVSRALPPYTWLTSVTQTSTTTSAAASVAPPPAKPGAKPAAKPDPKAAKKQAPATVPVDTLRFRIIGNTVDIQALTRFMRILEASPFIENVQLGQSILVTDQGKEVTQFQLDAQYQVPDSAAIRVQPIAISVR
jgi:Tfp pilus assembly protein PilN